MTGLWISLIAGLLLAAFAAAAETSLTSVGRIRMRTLAEEGSHGARVVVRLHSDPNAYLSTILTLNTVAVIVASTSAALMAATSHASPEWVPTFLLSIFVLI